VAGFSTVAAVTSDQWQFEQLLEKFHGNPPVNISDIRQFEVMLGRPLPADYIAFLLYANGGEGWVGKCYVVLCRLEEIFERNRACGFDEFAPGLLAFGSDGGGEAFAFDMRADGMPVVEVPFIYSGPEDEWPMGPNFYAFLVECSKRYLTDP
jgi:hypothetical protein